MIIPLIFLFIFYITTVIFALLAYILWYMLCTNVTLAFILTCQRCEVIGIHIESIDPDFQLHRGYKSASHPIDNTWHTAPQSPIQDWDPLLNHQQTLLLIQPLITTTR